MRLTHGRTTRNDAAPMNSSPKSERYDYRVWASFGSRAVPHVFLLLCAVCVAIVARLVYVDSFVSESAVSNRSFAPPALALSLLVSTFGLWRCRVGPMLVRLLVWPLAVSIGYLIFGLAFILLNGVVGEIAR